MVGDGVEEIIDGLVVVVVVVAAVVVVVDVGVATTTEVGKGVVGVEGRFVVGKGDGGLLLVTVTISSSS